MWKIIRVSALLIVLAAVAGQAWIDRLTTTDWNDTLWVGIFPLSADDSAAAARHIERLTVRDFAAIEEFFAREAGRFGVEVSRPVRVELYPPVKEPPPLLEPHSGPFGAAWWSLKLRWYARRAADVPGRAPAQVRVFVLYHDPEQTEQVPHSHGLQKGLIGVVHAFADRQMTGANNIVIAHEVMHTLGATDKYDRDTGMPTFPEGFADPDARPLYPQSDAEIMAGRRALSVHDFDMPAGLRDVVVGSQTALEIRWTEP